MKTCQGCKSEFKMEVYPPLVTDVLCTKCCIEKVTKFNGRTCITSLDGRCIKVWPDMLESDIGVRYLRAQLNNNTKELEKIHLETLNKK